MIDYVLPEDSTDVCTYVCACVYMYVIMTAESCSKNGIWAFLLKKY